MSMTDISKEIGNRWRNLSAAEKEPYESQAKEDKERYIAEMKVYKENKTRGGGPAEEGGEAEEDADTDAQEE
jgi:structure-specific recognition protein 1